MSYSVHCVCVTWAGTCTYWDSSSSRYVCTQFWKNHIVEATSCGLSSDARLAAAACSNVSHNRKMQAINLNRNSLVRNVRYSEWGGGIEYSHRTTGSTPGSCASSRQSRSCTRAASVEGVSQCAAAFTDINIMASGNRTASRSSASHRTDATASEIKTLQVRKYGIILFKINSLSLTADEYEPV